MLDPEPMHFAKYWVKGSHSGTESSGRPMEFQCWRWSDLSEEDATHQARQSARELAERHARGESFPESYGFSDRPLREEVVREIDNPEGQLCGVITRNAYGCLVLNTDRVMFVDVDIPELEKSAPNPGFFARLFGAKSHDVLLGGALRRAHAFAAANAGVGWRAYQTRAGMRFIATHALLDTEDKVTTSAFEQLQADLLYVRICQVQKSFRARLTPKHWRCNLPQPPSRWPHFDADAENRFKSWEATYLSVAREFATCRFLRSIGNECVHSEVKPIVDLRDQLTGKESDLPLA